jgi:hypothetical protein
MAELPPEYEVRAAAVAIDAGTGSGTLGLDTDKGPMALHLPADVLLLLKVRIDHMLAQERHGGLHMLPAAVGCHGLEASLGRSQLQIRLVLENESEARLPIQEAALHHLNKILTDWFADQDKQNSQDHFE